MTARDLPRGVVPTPVWGLDTGSVGEFDQLVALGRSLGLPFRSVRLTADQELVHSLPEEPPGLILSFGRAARAALRLRDRFARRPLLVHLGTPGHVPAAALDLIIPMPQDDYPPESNVQRLRLPLNRAPAEPEMLAAPTRTGPTTILIGGDSRHFRMTRGAVHRIVRFGESLAQANAEGLRVVTSPRTPPKALAWLARLRDAGHFDLHGFQDDTLPFGRALAEGGRFVVTADSASMVAEACRSAGPVWIFPLPRRPNLMTLLQTSSDRCFGRGFRHHLIRRGWVGGGTDFTRWHRQLAEDGYVRIVGRPSGDLLRWAPSGPRPDLDLSNCRSRILELLRSQRMAA